MPLLIGKELTQELEKRQRTRKNTAGTKLSQEEFAAFESHCRRLEIKPGELIRKLIITELARANNAPEPDLILSEIVGVRLLLVNLFQPREPGQPALSKTEFDSLLEQIKRVKREVAKDLERESSKGTTR